MLIKMALLRLLDVAEILILIRVIVSWLPLGRNRFIEIIYTITDPILIPIRSLLEKSMKGKSIMIDFSPIIAFLLIGFIKRFIMGM